MLFIGGITSSSDIHSDTQIDGKIFSITVKDVKKMYMQFKKKELTHLSSNFRELKSILISTNEH